MKKISFVVLLTTGLMLGSYAQDKQQDKLNEKDVPAVVQTSFKNEFTNAKDIEWKMKDGKYKVAFEINGTDHFAKYGTDGKLMAKGMKIRTSELPNAVATSVKASFADRTIDDVFRVDKDGAVFYLVKLNGNPDTKTLYSADGQVVNEKEKKDR